MHTTFYKPIQIFRPSYGPAFYLETNCFLFNIDNTFIDPVSRSETCKLYR